MHSWGHGVKTIYDISEAVCGRTPLPIFRATQDSDWWFIRSYLRLIHDKIGSLSREQTAGLELLH